MSLASILLSKNPSYSPPAACFLKLQTRMDTPLISATKEFVKQFMSQHDSSHDYQHVERVLTLSQKILAASQISVSPTVVTLLALLHDVGDKKYTSGSGNPRPVESFLLSAGAEPELAVLVQELADNVSYSHELANRDSVAAMVEQHPELAIVQDADRLDAIGAVGVARTFTYTAAKGKSGGMGEAIRHFDEKLLLLEGGMKTAEGKELAKVKGERIKAFREWWRDEVGE